jgi:transposase
MFIKNRPLVGHDSHFKVQVCENSRVNGKVVQKMLKHIGTARNEMELQVYQRAASLFIQETINARSKQEPLFDACGVIAEREMPLPKKKSVDLIEINDIQEDRKTIEGPRDVFAFAAEKAGLLEVVKGKDQKLLGDLIAARITEPDSKKKTHEILQKYAGFDCSLDKIYRLLTKLGMNEEIVNEKAFQHSVNLFEQQLDLLFFDVTTLYFESWDQDEIRDFGFSKDCKFGQVQVTLALATTADGFPIGYKLFPGNTAEITTLIKCVQDWKKYLPINETVFVADRGLFSAKNMLELQKNKFKFIVGCPLKKLSKAKAQEILNQDNYKPTTIDMETGSSFCWIGEFEHAMDGFEESENGTKRQVKIPGRIVASFSTHRALKDKNDRIKMIEKVREKLSLKKKNKASQTKLKEMIGNRGYSKFLEISEIEKAEIKINESRLLEEEKWDGMHGVFTNTNLRMQEVLKRYRGLWQIEECFRISKSNLKIRPIYHFTPTRIRGHIALCFLSLVTLKSVHRKLKSTGSKITIPKLIESISSVESTILKAKSTSKRYRLPSKMSDNAKEIYKCLGLKRNIELTSI